MSNLSSRTNITILFIIMATQASSVILVSLLSTGSRTIGTYQPFGSSIHGAIGNSLLLLAFTFILTSLFVWAMRRKSGELFLRRIFVLLIALTGFMMTYLLLSLIMRTITTPFLAMIVPILAGIGVVIPLILPGTHSRLIPFSSLTCLIIASEVGAYFAFTLEPPTIFLLPLFFAAYDIYAVFKGPLKHLIALNKGGLSPLTIVVGNIEIGIGDIVFYSMLPAVANIISGTAGFIVTLVTTNAGVVLTLWLANRVKVFPGLPLPVLFGTLAILVASELL